MCTHLKTNVICKLFDNLIVQNNLYDYTSTLGYSVENRPILVSSFGSVKEKFYYGHKCMEMKVPLRVL